MDARDKRFLHAVRRVSCHCPPSLLAYTGPDGQTEAWHGWPRLHHHREAFGGGRFAQVVVEPGSRFVPEEQASRPRTDPEDAPPRGSTSPPTRC